MFAVCTSCTDAGLWHGTQSISMEPPASLNDCIVCASLSRYNRRWLSVELAVYRHVEGHRDKEPRRRNINKDLEWFGRQPNFCVVLYRGLNKHARLSRAMIRKRGETYPSAMSVVYMRAYFRSTSPIVSCEVVYL
jgi:hypothetical protein